MLVGKAFFQVKRDTLHPFLVQIPDVSVEVLGTSFLIDATISDQSAVFVKDGVVKVDFGKRFTEDPSGKSHLRLAYHYLYI